MLLENRCRGQMEPLRLYLKAVVMKLLRFVVGQHKYRCGAYLKVVAVLLKGRCGTT